MSLKRIFILVVSLSKLSFLISIFSFFVLACPASGHIFNRNDSFILNYKTPDSILRSKEFFYWCHPFFPVQQNESEKWYSIPNFDDEGSSRSDQRLSFLQEDYAKNKSLSSSVYQRRMDELNPKQYGSGQAHHNIDYKKASVIGGLNLASITIGFREAINTWGESKSKFHIKDDWKGDGLAQTDELSHFMWGYKMTQFFYRVYDWVGFSRKTSQALSSSESALILTLVEYPIDAYNPKQGLGVSDLVFDYLGVGLAVAKKHCSWLNDFDFKISWKKNVFSENKTPFAQTYEEYDNFIYWLTYRPKLFLPKKLLCFGFGYSVTHLEFKPKREFYGGIGFSIPDFVSLFGKRLGDKSKFLEILYPNIRIKL
jgi:hypothetical protein